MNNNNIVNAKIIGTMLGTKQAPVFTCLLTLEMDHTRCTYGNYTLDKYNKNSDKREGTAIGLSAIMELMDVLEVECWEDLKGTYVRCLIAPDTSIFSIGHLIKEKWFSFEAFFGKYRKEHKDDSMSNL